MSNQPCPVCAIVPCTCCALCDAPATTTVSAPADTGPFTDVAESIAFCPPDRWDMPVCSDHRDEMLALVVCATCRATLPLVDAISNGSTVQLCRPCNAREGQ